VVLNDITERKRTQQELERLNRELEDRVRSRTAQLEAANKELEAFSYSVSHDLRAPVRHIDGFVKLLEREHPPATDKAAHYLRTIAASSQRMATLIDDLLALSRTGRAPLEMRMVQLGPLVEEVIGDLRHDLARRTLEWRVGALPAVRGDPSLLRVVLQNLLDNAVKYTRREPAALVEVGALRLDEGDTAIYVRDNGVGFDMRYADRLFGVFQRLHRAEDFEGTGVGLATARRVVHRHGGRIWGEGEPGRGACFYFTVEAAAVGQ
jgi:light-regulated signal transduction histidine kinase (bacteriophytochrome)